MYRQIRRRAYQAVAHKVDWLIGSDGKRLVLSDGWIPRLVLGPDIGTACDVCMDQMP